MNEIRDIRVDCSYYTTQPLAPISKKVITTDIIIMIPLGVCNIHFQRLLLFPDFEQTYILMIFNLYFNFIFWYTSVQYNCSKREKNETIRHIHLFFVSFVKLYILVQRYC